MIKQRTTPGIIIAGTSSGSGKTTISSAIMALLKREKTVQPFKTGPDYIDPQFHTAITRRKSRNLDSWMLEDSTIKYLYNRASDDADISVIEGVMGLFDGFGISHNEGSTAHVAAILGLPVIITVDGRAVSTSIAATVKGYAEFDKSINVAGVIFNKIHGERHFQLLKAAVEKYSDIPVLGYLPFSKDIELSERHLGLVPKGEVADINNKLEKLCSLAAETIDIESLIRIAEQKSINLSTPPSPVIPEKYSSDLKIAVAMDKAFNFYYQDNLELLKESGIELIEFSPLKDKCLPDNISGLILGGGFPEVFASELSRNFDMISSIREALGKGLPCYAECGGFMYLCESIRTFDKKTYNMVGWFSMKSEMTSRLQRFGYIELTLNSDTVIGKRGTSARAHEFHRSMVHSDDIPALYDISKEYFDGTVKKWNCGYSRKNTFGGYPHIHFYSAPEIASGFLRNCSEFLKNKKDKY